MAGALVALPVAASAEEITKTVPATVVYFTHEEPGIPTTVNCGSVAVVQWQDPTEHRFVGSSWTAHYYFNGVERTLTSQPPFDNTMSWFQTSLHATGGNNWIRLETSTGGRAASVGCSEFRARQEAKFGTTAWMTITGQEDRTDPEACKKAQAAYKKANKKVTDAQKKVRNATTSAAKASAIAKLKKAKNARAQAAAASGQACSG